MMSKKFLAAFFSSTEDSLPTNILCTAKNSAQVFEFVIGL